MSMPTAKADADSHTAYNYNIKITPRATPLKRIKILKTMYGNSCVPWSPLTFY